MTKYGGGTARNERFLLNTRPPQKPTFIVKILELDSEKKNFLIYSFMAYIRKFFFRGSQSENVDFFPQPPNESKFEKINFTNKKFVKMARKKNFLI